jgi:hypothetical protein
MKYRKLRFAWSVGCDIICLLLIVLWVRSYSHVDDLVVTLTATKQLELQSVPGRIVAFIAHAPSRPIDSLMRYMATTPEGAAHAGIQHGIVGGDWQMQTVWFAHWLVAVLSAILGTAPWMHRAKFSLRTLLIGMTVVAVALGLIFALSR